MFEIIGSGLILAIISGIAFIAYNHPDYYQKLFYFLFGLNQIVFIGVMLWDFSVNKSFKSLRVFIDPSKIEQAQQIIDVIAAPNWVFIVNILITIGIVALLFLPNKQAKQ